MMTSVTNNLTNEYVTVRIGQQLFGIPINRAHDVFIPEAMTRVPMAQREIAGILNLRGRIVTVIDMRCRLQMPPLGEDQNGMAVGIEFMGESFGLMIDAVGEVLKLQENEIGQNPINLDPRWASISVGVYQLEGELMVILDVDRLLESQMPKTKVAA